MPTLQNVKDMTIDSARRMAGIMESINKSSNRYRELQIASDRNRRDQETFELDKKERELKIQKLERSGQMSPTLQALIDMQKAEQKAAQTTFDAKGKIIDSSMIETDSALKSQKKMFGLELAGMNYNSGTDDVSLRYSRPITTKPASNTVGTVDKTLGILQTGGKMVEGDVEPFDSRDEAEAYARENLGVEWDKRFPKAIQLIESNFGPNAETFKNELKTNNITTTRQAFDYLVNKKGMKPEKAKQWLKDNN